MTLCSGLVRPTGGARSARARLKVLVSVGLMLSSCSSPPTVLLDTPNGLVPLDSPAPSSAMPAGLAGPPPGLEPSPPPLRAVQGGSRDGLYTGTATVLVTDGGLCTDTLKVSDFAARGNSARFGGFRGTIGADGGVQMYYGQDWITGQFEGATFRGQMVVQGRFDSPGCTYMLNLARTGP